MPKVTVYSTPTCVYCNMTKEFLSHHNVEYKDVNVAADPQEARNMLEKSGQLGVPVVIVSQDDSEEEKVIIGYDPDTLSELLDIQG